jgi:hypothetical protein
MAIEKIVEIKVDAKQATKSLQDLGGSFEDVYGEIQPLSGRIGELEDRLYEMALAGESGTKEFNDLTREIGSMKKVIIDTDRTVDGMSQTLAQNLGGAIGGVTAAFELGAGAMGAMGVESEKVQEALLKVQSASAIASGFQGLKESVSSFRALGAAIKASTVVQTVLNGVTAAYNVIMNLNPIAAIITSIFLLISAITALIMNFKSIMSFLGLIDDEEETLHKNRLARNRKEQELQDKKLKDLAKEKDELGKKHSFQERLMKAQGKSEEEIFKAIQKNRLERAKAAEEFARQTVIKNDLLTAEFNLLKANGDLTKEEADRINAAITENNKIIKDSNNEARALVEEIRIDDVAKTTAAENKKTEAVKKGNEKQAEIRKKAQEKKEADDKAALDKIIEQQKKESEDRAKLIEDIAKLEDDYLISKISKEQQEVNAVQDKYNAIIEAARLANEDITILEEAREKEEQAIRDKFLKERTDKELAAQQELQQQLFDLQADSVQKTLDGLDISRDAELLKLQEKLDAKLITQEQFEQAQAAVVANFTAQTDKVKKDADDADLARKAAAAEQNLQLASDSLGAISGLVTAFAGESEAAQRKAFNINKAISIGQAIISTAQGVIAQLAVPQDALTGANFVKAGIVAATGAAQIATISRTQFKGGGTVGGVDGGGTSNPTTAQSQPANFNVVGNTGTNQLADTLGSSPMKAYVVAGDVTSAQSLERNKIQQSTL